MLRPATLARAGFAFVLLTLTHSPASTAGQPDPFRSTSEHRLYAAPSGTVWAQCHNYRPEPGATFVIKDADDNPLPGVLVTLDFSAGFMRVFPDDRPETIVDCNTGAVSMITDGAGEATFFLRLGGMTLSTDIPVLADGVYLFSTKGVTPDYNRDGTTGIADLAIFAAAFQKPGFENFDLNGCPEGQDWVNVGDFAIFVQEYLANVSQPPCY